MFWLITFVVLISGHKSSADSFFGNIDFNSLLETSNAEVKQIVSSDSVYVGAGSNYAVSASSLMQFNWASVNVNGESVQMITPDCNVIEKNLNEIGEDERRALDMAADITRSGGPSKTEIVSGSALYQSSSIGGQVSSIKSDGVSVEQVDDNHRMISTPSLTAANVKWLSMDNDLVTLIFSDNKLQMRPKSCLDASAQQLLSATETEITGAQVTADVMRADREQARQAKLAERENLRAAKEAARLERQAAREQMRQARQQRRMSRYN